MSDFLPSNYKVPVSQNGGYMKLQTGKNKFRILTSPVIGYEYWKEIEDGRKPVRVRMDVKVSPNELGEDGVLKHFWAMVVWNYSVGEIQILEITQKNIQKAIKELASDEEWGSPLEYDLTITKEVEKLETR